MNKIQIVGSDGSKFANITFDSASKGDHVECKEDFIQSLKFVDYISSDDDYSNYSDDETDENHSSYSKKNAEIQHTNISPISSDSVKYLITYINENTKNLQDIAMYDYDESKEDLYKDSLNITKILLKNIHTDDINSDIQEKSIIETVGLVLLCYYGDESEEVKLLWRDWVQDTVMWSFSVDYDKIWEEFKVKKNSLLNIQSYNLNTLQNLIIKCNDVEFYKELLKKSKYRLDCGVTKFVEDSNIIEEINKDILDELKYKNYKKRYIDR